MKDLACRLAPLVSALPNPSPSIVGAIVCLSTDGRLYNCDGNTWWTLGTDPNVYDSICYYGAASYAGFQAPKTVYSLSAASAALTTTTQTPVITMAAVPPGTYKFNCMLIYQTTATTTGIDVSVGFTGTASTFLVEHRYASTATTAATAAASEAASGSTGAHYEAQGKRTIGALIGAGTVSVDSANANMMSTIEGFIQITATGDLSIRMAPEAAGLSCSARPGTSLTLERLF